MIKPALPKNESERLNALLEYEVLDTPNEAGFDQLTQLAAHIAGTPIALVSLVDNKRQWHKSCVGVNIIETDRNISFCGHAILQDEPMIINDARTDRRFTLNPLVTGPLGIRFYAGIPLVTPNGQKIGTLCVIDTQARWITREQVEALQNLAAQVIDQLESRHKVRQLKAAQALLEKANEEARLADSAKNQFLANMSHEIRTPMNGIIGMTGLLIDAEENIETRGRLDIIRNCSEHLLKLINDILDLSKIAAGKVELESQGFNPRKLAMELSELFNEPASSKNIQMRAEIAEDLPQHLDGDSYRLRQIINNLLNNALKFTDVGEICLSVTSTRVAGSMHRLRIGVRDTGIGIAPDKHSKIFEPFTQADLSTSRMYGGTGLGLSISRDLVERMHGKMWLESAPGEGSAFFFEVVLNEADADATVVDTKLTSEGPKDPRFKVLVAEDNSTNQKVVGAYLRKLGYEPDFVENGREALDRLSVQDYAIVFMDCQMPIMNGYRATEAILRNFPQNRVPYIVALTASATDLDRSKCIAVGMHDFVSKPFKMRDLKRVLDVVYSNFQGPQAFAL
jgi:two-component system, sensor histidine kinase